MIKAIIFDMDGVIIDSEPFHWEVNKRIFAELGIKVTDEYYSRFIGVSNIAMWTELKEKYLLPLTVTALSTMQQNGNILHMQQYPVPSVPGAIELICDLKTRNYLIALASSSPHPIIDIVLNTFGVKQCFDIVVSGEDFKNGKPSPDIFLKTAMLLNVAPSQCVVIEDSMHGVQAAKSANMKCIGFANKNSGNQDLGKADLVISDMRELNFHQFLSKHEG